ncbi:MAG: glycosyltransferase [Actinobacteria bacterium]|nr:glycosyltransferase [Actinomycetota bacterium]
MSDRAGLGAKLIGSAREKVISVLELGQSAGLSQSKLLPTRAKGWLHRKYRMLAGLSAPKRKGWEFEVFNLFWKGQYSKFHEAISTRLNEQKPLKLAQLEMVVRMVWHAAANGVLIVDEKLATGFQNQLKLLKENVPSIYLQGQWLAAEQLSKPSETSSNSEVNDFAALSRQANLQLSEDLAQSIAAIRFGLPENWISGHESEPREELQHELRLWLSWLHLSSDSDTLRHARKNMLKSKSFKSVLVIDEGYPNTSNLPLVKYGLQLAPSGLSKYQPVAKSAIYLLHNSLPWDSQGYATRSHAIIKSTNSQGWSVAGVTRLGYPFDRHTNTRAEEIPEISVIDGVTYHRLGKKLGALSGVSNFLNAYAARAAKLVGELKPQVIHAASSNWNGIVGNHLAKQVNVPSVYEVRGLWEVTARSREPGYEFTLRHRLSVALETQACNDASHVFALTNALKAELIRRGVNSEKITILPNCVDVDRFLPRQRDLELEASLGLASKTVIGYVGSLLDYEGLNLLMLAAKQLGANRDDFHVLIVGGGAEYENLVKQVTDLGIQKLVTFTGRVPHADVERYYSLIDIAPFPRLALPVCEMVSPLKPFEAMAMEKVCVVSSVDALTEIVQDGVTGRVFEKNSAADLARVLAELLDDPAQIREFGKTSRNWVHEQRTWARNAQIVHDTYESLLSQHTK